MVKKKSFRNIIFIVLCVIVLENISPTIYKCYAISENGDSFEFIDNDETLNDESNNSDIANIDDIENSKNDEVKEYNPIDQVQEDNMVENNENFILEMNQEDMPIVGTASGSGTGVGNEGEFSSAFYNTGVSEITIGSSIRLNSSYTVNHTVRIDSSAQSGSNSLRLSSGCGITVSSGCVLTLDEVVIDGRTYGNDDGKSCITVKNGGVLMLIGHSIIDGGGKNWGINVESGGQLLVVSCQITNCERGIVAQGRSYCDFASQNAAQWWGNDGKTIDITNNSIGIYCGGEFRGTLIVNHLSQNGEKINFQSNTWGIYSQAHTGTINIVRARMVYNGWAIYTNGNMDISGINGAYNSRGIVNEGGTVNFISGTFYADGDNLKEYGIYNSFGTVNLKGGSVTNDVVGIFNGEHGIINISSGNVKHCTTGIENKGTVNFSEGVIKSGSIRSI